MKEAIKQLRDDRDLQAEKDEREWDELKDKHDRLRAEARKELGFPEPKDRGQAQQPGRDEAEPSTKQPDSERDTPEPDIETDRYGNQIIDMSGPVEPEPSRDEPPFKPDNLVPDTYYDGPARPEPEPGLDWEMGD